MIASTTPTATKARISSVVKVIPAVRVRERFKHTDRLRAIADHGCDRRDRRATLPAAPRRVAATKPS
jgi:hypothetical protein